MQSFALHLRHVRVFAKRSFASKEVDHLNPPPLRTKLRFVSNGYKAPLPHGL